MDRAQLARYVHRSIAELARGAAWSTATRSEDGDTLSEGDYTDAIDSALRQLGFVDLITGIPDETLATELDFETIATLVRQISLERLAAYYATVVDTVGGPVRIYRSQVAAALQRMGVAGGSSSRLATSALGSLVSQSLLADDI